MDNSVEFIDEYKIKHAISDKCHIKLYCRESGDMWILTYKNYQYGKEEVFSFKTESEAQAIFDKLRGKEAVVAFYATTEKCKNPNMGWGWSWLTSTLKECESFTTSPVIDSDEELISLLRSKLSETTQKLDKIRDYVAYVCNAPDTSKYSVAFRKIKSILEEGE